MIKKTVTAIVFVALSILAYSQDYPIPAPNSQWGEVTVYGPPGLPGAGSYGSIYRYEGRDTVINNLEYQYWQSLFTRYEDRRVIMIDRYRSKPDSIAEVVLYDFNLALNDRFLLPLPYMEIYATVSKVSDFITLNGQTRKEITLNVNDLTCTSELKWIEGIGDIDHGIFYPFEIAMCDIYNRVVCFSDSSGAVYKESNFDYPCDSLDHYIKLFDEITEFAANDNEIEVMPNPVTDKLVLKTMGDFDKIEIINMNGEVLIKSENKEIDCSNLKSSVYLLIVSKGNHTIGVSRFIKQ